MMKKYLAIVLSLSALILSSCCGTSENASFANRAERIVAEIHNPSSKKVIVAVHGVATDSMRICTLREALDCGDPAQIYDQVIALGATMIQSDRPEQLIGYLRSKGLHD